MIALLLLNTTYKYKIKTEKLEKELAELLRRRIEDCLNHLNWHYGDKNVCDSLRQKLQELKKLPDKDITNNDNKKKIEKIKKEIKKIKKPLKS